MAYARPASRTSVLFRKFTRILGDRCIHARGVALARRIYRFASLARLASAAPRTPELRRNFRNSTLVDQGCGAHEPAGPAFQLEREADEDDVLLADERLQIDQRFDRGNSA